MMEEARQDGDMEMRPDIMVNSPKYQQVVYKECLEIGLRDDGRRLADPAFEFAYLVVADFFPLQV
jgi:hypothetical protein